jgi:hypothetical protein
LGNVRISPRFATVEKHNQYEFAAAKPGTQSGMGLTKNLLQLHDRGIGTDAMDGLRLLEIHPLLKHLTVCAIGVVLIRHCSGVELNKLERCGEEVLTSSAELS